MMAVIVYNPDDTVASTTSTDGAIGSTPDASTLTTDYTYYPNGQQESVTQLNVPVWIGTNTTPQNQFKMVTLPSTYDLGNSFSSTLSWDGSGAYVSSGTSEKLPLDIQFAASQTPPLPPPATPGAVLYDPSAGSALGGNGSNWVLVIDDGNGHVDTTTFTIGSTGLFTPDGVKTGSDFTSNHPSFYGFDLETTYQYNTVGQQSDVTDPLGHTTSTEYDALGRQIATGFAPVNGVSTTTSETYDAAGNKATETDQLGRVTTYKYNAAGELVEVDQPQVPNSSNVMTTPVTKYTYDVYGDELSQTDANGNVTTFTYDALGHELTRKLPDGESESFTYDQFGRAFTHTDFKQQVTGYVYDNSATGDGRLTAEYFFATGVTFQNSTTHQFHYSKRRAKHDVHV